MRTTRITRDSTKPCNWTEWVKPFHPLTYGSRGNADYQKVPAAKMRELEQEIEDVQEKQDQVNADVSRLAREQDQLYQRYVHCHVAVGMSLKLRHEELANIDKKREKDARLWDPSIDYALDYLEKNEARLFEAPVIRPACMSVNVKDKRLAKQLENCTSMGQRKVSIASPSL